ncbi:MAG: hypothetical protein H0V66_15815, partial [Bdellovibrionales bacterium]|nr:hypothetical protein [Bdellovibrionales bacterium]
TKSLGFTIDKDKMVVLFKKENRPFMDKLSFQVINTRTLEGEIVVDTEYMSDKAEVADNGFYFRTFEERNGMDMGKIKIAEIVHTFQDRIFPMWMRYSLKGFEVAAQLSFQKFEWKGYFKDEKDFYLTTGWDETNKKFNNTILYVAVNHHAKKECILLSPTKIKITGAEPGWRCNQSL